MTFEDQIRIVRSQRKTIEIRIGADCLVTVRAPYCASDAEIMRFVERKRGWIETHLAQMKECKKQLGDVEPLSIKDINELADLALKKIPSKVSSYAQKLGVSYGRITIRNQKTRWGSCSSKGNLNFNCLLMLCPDEVVDYVVVHELCHRLEMNHSAAFWALVRAVLPDYEQRKEWLKIHGTGIMQRMVGGR